MKRQDLAELVLLAALWGASFLFIRMGAAEFGPLALAWMRVAGAALVLLPMLMLKGEVAAMRANWRTIAFVGFTNSVIPFVLFAYALLAGLAPAGPARRTARTAVIVVALMLGGYAVVLLTAPAPLLMTNVRSINRLLLQLWPSALLAYFLGVRTVEEAGAAAPRVSPA